jgi:hypothetical protein
MAICVFLADLKGDDSDVASEEYKSLETASMKAVRERHDPEIRSRQFVYPSVLLNEFARQPPDVLMLRNQVWNEVPNLYVARLAKRISPRTFVVIVGPTPPSDPEKQNQEVAEKPNVDLYVFCEGESCASQVVQSFLIASKSLKNARPQRIIRSLEQISRSIALYQAVQCLDAEVGQNIKRSLETGGPSRTGDSSCQRNIELI